MLKSAIVGAAAIFASALASPAVAQEVITNPGKCAQYYPNANCQNLGPGNPIPAAINVMPIRMAVPTTAIIAGTATASIAGGIWPGDDGPPAS